MKYCLSARQPKEILMKADEIKIEQRDYKAIPDYIDNYPDKVLILELDKNLPENFPWKDLVLYHQKMNGNFYCAVDNIIQLQICKDLKINYYYKHMATSFYELQALKELEVSYVLIGAPLIFNLDAVKNTNIPIRAIPHIAYEPYLPHKNGICGGWIRPEDVSAYEKYITVFEFRALKNLEKEATLYHIYGERGTWDGNLNLLIDNLNFNFDNRALYDEENFAIRRMNCKQTCQVNGNCNYCRSQLEFVSTINKLKKRKNTSN